MPDQVLAPDSSVAGLLRIENNGRATLELDAYLPNPRGPFAGMAGEPVAGCVQGILKGSNERVLLCNILRTGGRSSSNGISFERYSAEHCLLGSTSWGAGKQAPLFTTQSIPLTGFEEWLRLGAIKVEHALEQIPVDFTHSLHA